MASLDFETEKNSFKDFFDINRLKLEIAKNTLVSLINSLTADPAIATVSKVEGRVKDRDECLSKFTRKYRNDLENRKESYEIKNYITDLIGIRIVCLYEDEIEKIRDILKSNFDITGVTNKIIEVEGTESSFGYKGLHVDLKHNEQRLRLPEYSLYQDFNFEVQIRTVVQDSWSIIDHKIKYKKSIPNELKRRINTLAALFELADREFRAIRDATFEEIRKAETSYVEISAETEVVRTRELSEAAVSPSKINFNYLDAFSFERIAGHFFKEIDFEGYKVDGFVQEVTNMKPDLTRGRFNYYMKENVSNIKQYRDDSLLKMNPYTIIRHCLYAGDPTIFANILTSDAKISFESWKAGRLEAQGTH